MYISPETRDTIGRCYFCPETQIPVLLKGCKIEDLVYVQIYWSITGFLMSERSKGVNPGFDGFQWIKEMFPSRFGFIKLKKIPIKENKVPAQSANQAQIKKKAQGSTNAKGESPTKDYSSALKKDLDDESFPTLGGKQSTKPGADKKVDKN